MSSTEMSEEEKDRYWPHRNNQNKWQNTHWYKSMLSTGSTSQPEYAAPGEIERKGIHDCSFLACANPCAGGYPRIYIEGGDWN